MKDTAAARELVQRITLELHKRVVGQEEMIERLLIGLMTGGHVLLEGVPGLAKTLTVSSLAESIDARQAGNALPTFAVEDKPGPNQVAGA